MPTAPVPCFAARTGSLSSRYVAVVTGGNSGIGLAIAMALAQVGCHIVIGARN